MGGGDPTMNIRLRKAIDDAKAVSMPRDNIERAVKRGTGEIDGANLEEILYEGYGPGGVAILCEIMTDNRNRTAPEMRTLFSKYGGNLGGANCVAYLFDRKGLFVFPAGTSEEQVTEVALEHGAQDVRPQDDGRIEVICEVENFTELSDAFDNAKLTADVRQVTRIAQTMVEVDSETARSVLKLLEALDEHDDVQTVSSNLNIPAEVLAELAQTG